MISAALVLSMMATESGFNPAAVSNKNAVGLLQVTPIALEEVYQQYPRISKDIDLLDPVDNIICSVLLLRHYSKVAADETELLIMYSGGYGQLYKYRSNVPLAKETEMYVKSVQNRLSMFTQSLPFMEEVRWVIKRIHYISEPDDQFYPTLIEEFEPIRRAT